VSRAVEALVWWIVLTGIWLLTLTSFSVQELSAALVAGLLCALVATTARESYRASWRPRARWLSWIALLPHTVVADTVRVLGPRLRTPAERRRIPVDDDGAVATMVVSAAPGTVVLDDRVAEATGNRTTLVVHALVPAGSRIERSVRS